MSYSDVKKTGFEFLPLAILAENMMRLVPGLVPYDIYLQYTIIILLYLGSVFPNFIPH